MAGERVRTPFALPPPIKPLRSLRVKVLLVVTAVALAPLGLVAAWSALERNIEADMRVRVAFTADEIADQLATRGVLLTAGGGVRSHGEVTRRVAESVARLHGVRVRVLRLPTGSGADADANFDQGTDPVHQIGTLFFGADGAPTLEAFDRTLDPVAQRPELDEARARGTVAGCRTATGGKLLVCHGVRVVGGIDGSEVVVYVQESSRRAVRALYDLRYQLARLSLTTIPLALLLAYWMGKRVVAPVEALRTQALARAVAVASPGQGANATAPLVVRGQDETQDLAAAFNALLEKLAQRQGENERFVADLVHEFKNPVAAIRAAADAVASGPQDEARARRLGKVLLDSSARLDALVSQFLELARAEAGLPREARSHVDMAALARGLVEATRVSFEGVEIDVRAEQPAWVVGVEHGLDSALRNLLENAASFARPTASAPARVVVEARAQGARTIVAVTDSGPGIAEEDLPRVFTRFFTTRERARRTGLGLALVRAIVEAHGGTVSVTSTAGRGTTFEIVLPRAEAPADSHRFHTGRGDVSSGRDA